MLSFQDCCTFINAMILLNRNILVIFKRPMSLIYLSLFLANNVIISSKGIVAKRSTQKLGPITYLLAICEGYTTSFNVLGFKNVVLKFIIKSKKKIASKMPSMMFNTFAY